MGLSIDEMIKSMMEGKILVNKDKAKAFYDPTDSEFGPFVYVYYTYVQRQKMSLTSALFFQEWEIYNPPIEIYMTKDEILNFVAENPNVLVRCIKNNMWGLPSQVSFDKPDFYEYCFVINGQRSEPRKFIKNR